MSAGAVDTPDHHERDGRDRPPVRVPGRMASAVRRLGMGAVQRMPMLKRLFMNEARGMSGCRACCRIRFSFGRRAGPVRGSAGDAGAGWASALTSSWSSAARTWA